MEKTVYQLNTDYRMGQAIILFMTAAFFLFTVPFYFITGKLHLPVAFLLLGVLLNWIASFQNHVYVQGDYLYIVNLYRSTRRMEGSLFSHVEASPAGEQSYYLCLKDKRRVAFRNTKSQFIFQRDTQVIQQMNNQIKLTLAKQSFDETSPTGCQSIKGRILT